MARKSILVTGPRELPPAGPVTVWIDAGSGPGYARQVWASDLTVSELDDGQGTSAVYALTQVECDG
ncbi:hypothetical protein [Actinoplanes flavus]|uniref:Uncharacterized protein n=1 Tax=Actinoplanes flavus TaxID=2820290 RepID=A0ABS3UDV8_9ACTN|nr:hypothetical protein [Actinoplanes flavus]MBO3736957.1 hypothetical protein [Actinoplanes flavus]